MDEPVAAGRLAAGEIDEVLGLVETATRHDGVAALSEQSLLSLRHGGAGYLAIPARVTGGRIVGYAGLDVAGMSGELVVHPDHRRRGHGRALLRAMRDASGERLRVWAHGDLPGAAALGAAAGLVRVRVLLQMRRPGGPLPAAAIPEGVRVRTFVPGQDEAAWLAANRRAFADHPEQGRLTFGDLHDRIAEPWFDPAGFFLAERSGELVGYHWTKAHPEGVGEVYVVGVDPAAQGLGLGRALTLLGLRHLQEDRGLDPVILYADESNVRALRLYESLGFTRDVAHAMYGRPGNSGS